jgi:Flp pilus assembly protein TadD
MGTEETFAPDLPARVPVPAKRKTFLLSGLLFVWTLGTFLPAVHNDFINCDDDVYVTANQHVRGGLTLQNVQWAFRTTTAANWHPLTWLSHMLDCELFGLRPWGHHLSSVLLHAVNVTLLFLVLKRMTGATLRSFAVAAIFGLHPLRVESVAWVAERKDVLSVFFWILTVWAYAEYARRPGEKSTDPTPIVEGEGQENAGGAKCSGSTWGWYFLALLFFALGLMSKPMLVTLPMVLLLLDHWPLARWQNGNIRKLVVEKIPFLLLAVASCAVTFVAQKQGEAMSLMAGVTVPARLANALVSYCRYLEKLVWPANLSVIYPVVNSWPASEVVGSCLLLLCVSVIAIVLWRSAPYLATGWFWFLGTLVPVIGLVAVGEQSIANRYTYIPSIGLLIALVWGAHDLLRRRWFPSWASALLATAAVVLCVVVTRWNLGLWRNSETLFAYATQVTQNNSAALSNLGNALLDQGRPDEALSRFQEAARLKPRSAAVHNNLGVALGELGRLNEAIGQFQEALQLVPDHAHARFNLGKALERKGQLDEAMGEYQMALKLEPDYPEALNSLGIVLAEKGRLEEAILEFQQAIQLNPEDDSAHNNLGIALTRQGNPGAAENQFKEALRLNPANRSAQQNLDDILKMKGRP